MTHPVRVRLRPATSPGDAALIAEIEAASADAPWPEPAIHASLALCTTRAWIAEVQGQAVGHLLASSVADVGEVLTVAVRPEARRRGIGATLLDACMARWVEEGVTEAFLEVRAHNTPARALYERAGWREVGRRSGYYADGEDAIVMRWRG